VEVRPAGISKVRYGVRACVIQAVVGNRPVRSTSVHAAGAWPRPERTQGVSGSQSHVRPGGTCKVCSWLTCALCTHGD